MEQQALPIIQSCWVVPDIRQAARGWIAMGVGPFFTFDMDFPDALYRGRHVPLRFSVALAQAGSVQIELITQLSDGPSTYRDGISPGQSAFHHVCREFGRYDETRQRLLALGIEIATEASYNGIRVCYADTRATLGCVLELVDDSEMGRQLNAMVRDASIGWDGREPVRQVGAPGS